MLLSEALLKFTARFLERDIEGGVKGSGFDDHSLI